MQQFNWRDLASDELIASIYDAVRATNVASVQEIRSLLVQLFEIIGGPPLTENTVSDRAAKHIAQGLLNDALRQAFAKDIVSYQSTGLILQNSTNAPFKSHIVLGDFVHINWCTEKELADLPEIGLKLAQRIVAERHRNGAFKGGKDLAVRVSGIGEQAVTRLLPRLRFSHRPTATPAPTDVFDLLRMLGGKVGVDPEESLRRVLEYTISYLRDKTPTRWYADQRFDMDPPDGPHTCAWAGILRGAQYYYWLREALDNAQQQVTMAMFHVALPDAHHPTRLLLNKLIAAQQRGLRVRVLLDQDREEDDYESSVINSNALEVLRGGGVDVRRDQAERLLHSKFLVLDSLTTVVGSHNWSAGSYFHYDDLSIVLNAPTLAQELEQRFEQLWMLAEP